MKVQERTFFSRFCRISEALASTHDRQEVFDLIVESVTAALEVKGCALMVLEPGARRLQVVASYGLSRAYLGKGAVSADSSIAEAMKGMVVAIADAQSDTRMQYPDAAKREGIASILVAPLKKGNVVLGALRVYTAQRREFSPEEIDFVSAVGVQGALALENARLYETLTEHYRLFREVGSSIISTLKTDEVLAKIVRGTVEAVGAKGGALRLLDGDRKKLELVASFGLSKQYLAKGPVTAEASIPETMQGETVCIRDAASDERIQYGAHAADEGICSILSVPLKVRGTIVGALRLYFESIREFMPEEIVLAEALAQQGAIALENASMYSSMKDSYEDLRDNLWSHRSWF